MKIVSQMVEVHVIRQVNSQIEFLLLKRAPGEIYENLWQMVSGRIEPEEKAYETALREVKEETGFTAQRIWAAPNVNSFYSAHNDEMNLIPVFAVLVNPEAKVVISDEHSDYKWLTKEECSIMLAWEGQRKSVDIIYDYFLNFRGFLDLVEIFV